MELIIAKVTLGDREYSVRVMRKHWFKFHVVTQGGGTDIADFNNLDDCMKHVKKRHGNGVYRELMTYWRDATLDPRAHGRMLEVLSELYNRPPLGRENV